MSNMTISELHRELRPQYIALVDINGPENKTVWTLTREQLDTIVSLMMEHGDDDAENLGVSIGRALRAML